GPRPRGRSSAAAALGRAADAGADAGEGGVVIDGAPGLRVGEPLLDGLADIDLVGEVVPARPSGELVDEALRVVADVRGVGHAWKLSRRGGGRNCGRPGVGGESA